MSGVPFDIWQTGGITEHLGGVAATRRLLELCRPLPGQFVLDIGCGTGYTACALARTRGVRVAALDRLANNLARTRRRALKAGVAGQVIGLCADAHELPFGDEDFDLVIAESVLAFCDAPRVVAGRIAEFAGGYVGNTDVSGIGVGGAPESCRIEPDRCRDAENKSMGTTCQPHPGGWCWGISRRAGQGAGEFQNQPGFHQP